MFLLNYCFVIDGHISTQSASPRSETGFLGRYLIVRLKRSEKTLANELLLEECLVFLLIKN